MSPDEPRHPTFDVRRTGAERLAELEPLWAAMQAHHVSGAPAALTEEVAGFRDRAESWARRCALYESWFAAGSAVLHLAEDDAAQVAGYAMVRISAGGWSQLATPEPIAELESLSVAPEHRGRGLGTRLLEAVHADLRERGVEMLTLTVFSGNDAAARLYSRFGMQPVLTQMIGRVPARPARG